ncbi:hypothetical protein K443DRAFT_11639 [Laccaria amethystina LaAM-08-1]|uniref:Uncharacterized protein n=1 Tax=Laccaria amethystina LaAM-08-1 TaxID=1095629 RepID=A0A0C9WJP7_9AGAR|nr:hypothetical protein K443DRAFT_11639 [Laccaria amethystina LaAM-08-1]
MLQEAFNKLLLTQLSTRKPPGFCAIHLDHTLTALQTAIQKFHTHHEIFRTSGGRHTGFNLPQQHSRVHFIHQIQEFGAPGGLCSSIMESHHITAVKRPWCRSNRYEALGQMLLTNEQLDKLLRALADFIEHEMLPPICHLPNLSYPLATMTMTLGSSMSS